MYLFVKDTIWQTQNAECKMQNAKQKIVAKNTVHKV